MRSTFEMLAGSVVALTLPACAQQPTAAGVLQNLRASYAALTAVHIVVEREETTYPQGRMITTSSECELAAKSGHRYFARLRLGGGEALAVSDGNSIWKALSARKQWSKVSAASLASDNEDEEDTGSRDFADVLKSMLLGHYPAIAKAALDPVILKEEDFKLGREKTRCYLLKLRTATSEHELLIDKQRFLVLRYKQTAQSGNGKYEILLKTKLLEINAQAEDFPFRFEPDRAWTEVEALVLPGEQRVVLIGEHAANFTLKTLDGEPVALDGLKGKVVVLDFWATWCPPCRAELPSIEKLRAEFNGDVQFYGVNDEASGTVKKFIVAHHYDMPVLLDDQRAVHRRYGVRAIPALFIIGRDGIVREQFTGTRDEALLRKAIRTVLNSKSM